MATTPLPAALEQPLLAVHRAWNAGERLALIAAAGGPAQLFNESLLRLLGQPDHMLFKAAVEVCATHRIHGADLRLRGLVLRGPPAAKGIAVSAANAIEPWADDQVDDLLASEHRTVVLAALAIAAERRQQRPAVLPLLQHADAEIRRAALQAVPEGAAELQADLLRRAHSAGAPLAEVARALRKTGMTAAAEAALTELLSHTDADVRRAALDGLRSKRGPLLQADALWTLAGRTDDPLEQAHCVYAVEQSESVAVTAVQRALPALHPYARYFAARCLIAVGSRDGVAELLDLLALESDAFAGVPADKVSAALQTARSFLAQSARTSLWVELSVWRAWYGGVTRIPAQTLADPGL
jgi:hypothetical protein